MATRTFNFLVDCQIIVGIKDRLLMLKRVNENYNVKITDLEEYRRNRPLIETLKANNLELEKAKKRLFDLEVELFKRQQERSVSNSEFELVNTELKPSIESAELYNLAKDLYLHPSKHADIIRNMRERSELQSTPTNRADLTGVIRTIRQRSWPQDALVDTSKVNIFNPPPPQASLPSGTPIYRTGTATQNPTQPTQSELPTSLPGLLKDVNPVTPVNLTGDNPSPLDQPTIQFQVQHRQTRHYLIHLQVQQPRLSQLTHYLSTIQIRIHHQLSKILQPQLTLIQPMLIQPMLIQSMLIQSMLINRLTIIYDNPLSGIKLFNVEADNRIIFQNAKPTSASPSSIATSQQGQL